MFRCTPFRSFSSRDHAGQRDLIGRRRQVAELFGMEGEPDERGDRVVIRSESRTLEIYRSSDSLWWTDHDLAGVDAPKASRKLLSEAEATAEAHRELARLGLDLQAASVSSVDFVEGFVNVNYRFSLVDRPVLGPGAKAKVSFGEGGRLAQIFYFWRRPTAAETLPCISVDEALQRFQRDPGFLRLRHTGAIVEVVNITLGYYALPPTEFQRFYIPIYAIDAIVSTEELPHHEFCRHIVAVRVPAESAESMRFF